MGSDKDLTIVAEIDRAAIDTAIEALMATGEIPGVAIAVVHGDATYVRGYGVREKGKSATVTPDTLFACASTTKAFTTAGMALLVGEGKMGWDDPVRKHLPAFRLSDPLADACVTVRDLVCHRTGLPRHDMLWYRSPWGREEILRRIGFAKLNGTFRQKYQYQNICFLAAGEATRAASGAESWEAFLKERLLTPLGMTRTNFSTKDAQKATDHASPHQRLKGKVQATPWLNFDAIGPAGTMNSCANDMLRWLQFQLAGGVLPDGTRLIAESLLRETHTPQMVTPIDDDTRARYPECKQMSYALGWGLWDYRRHSVLSHGGAIDGFRAQVVLIPSEKIGIAVFVNIGAPASEMIRNTLLDLLLGLPPAKDWNAELKADIAKIEKERKAKEKERREKSKNGTPSPIPLPDYVGTYEDPAYGTVTVSRAKGKKNSGLSIQWNQFESPLKHLTFATFLTDTEADGFAHVEVRFRVGAGGEVEALALFDGEFVKAKSSATVTK